MSILNNDNPTQPSAEKIAADKIKQITRATFEIMVSAFNAGSIEFWNNPNGAISSGIAVELGSNAGEVFYLHARLGELIGLIDPSRIQQGLEVVGQFTQNEDGTVTVIPPSGV